MLRKKVQNPVVWGMWLTALVPQVLTRQKSPAAGTVFVLVILPCKRVRGDSQENAWSRASAPACCEHNSVVNGIFSLKSE